MKLEDKGGRIIFYRRPIIAFALCWVGGYALAVHYAPTWLGCWSAIACGLLAAALYRREGRAAKGAAAVLLILAAAGWYAAYDQRNATEIEAEAGQQTAVTLRGAIVTPVQIDGDRVSFQATGTQVDYGDAAWQPRPGERFQVSIRLLKESEQQAARQWERGDAITLGGTLDKPQEARNFGGFDYRSYLYYKHIHWQLSVKGLEQAAVEKPKTDEWAMWHPLRNVDRLRGKLGERIERLFPADQVGFMKGMLIGMDDEMAPEQFDMFSKLGLTHIIAVSGLNVAIFLGCLMWAMRRLGMTRERMLLVGFCLLPLYIAATGASPSIVRAGLMAMVALYAAYRRTLKDGLHIALGAGVLMLMWNPYYLLDVSFQLSYLVTLGLIVFVPAVSARLPIRSRKLREATSITVVAQLVSFPLTIFYFNQFSLLSFAANFLFVPVFSLFTMPVGLIALFSGLLWLPLGTGVAWLVAKGNALMFWLIGLTSRLDTFQTIWASPEPLWLTLYYGLLGLAVFALQVAFTPPGRKPEPMLSAPDEIRRRLRERRMVRRALLPLSLAGLIALLGSGYLTPPGGANGAEVHFIDVGQGDSIFIRSAEGKTLLVDGGGTVAFGASGEAWRKRRDPYEVGDKLLVPLLKKRGVQRIDELLLTHQDADHYGGLQAVLEQIPVTRLIFNGTLKPGLGTEKLFQTALARGTRLMAAGEGDRLEIDAGTQLLFLAPKREAKPALRLEEDQNPSSLVFYMQLEGTRWLFTGDIDAAVERAVLAEAAAREAGAGGVAGFAPLDVLKVAHHGSKTATSAEWLAAWRPKHAVISVGARNVYGHPAPAVLTRLTAAGTAVHRTDLEGEIQMQARGGHIYMRTKLGGIFSVE